DRDRGVRDVEGGEIPIPPVEIDEIDDVRVPHAIDDVTERTAEDERQADRQDELLGRADPAQPYQQHDAHDQCECDEEPALPTARVVEHAERSTPIFQIDDVEERQELNAA